LDQPVGERRLAMVDMRDDGKIADAGKLGHRTRALASGPGAGKGGGQEVGQTSSRSPSIRAKSRRLRVISRALQQPKQDGPCREPGPCRVRCARSRSALVEQHSGQVLWRRRLREKLLEKWKGLIVRDPAAESLQQR
jgi:hypothetical protein